jgi:hypothetical protein
MDLKIDFNSLKKGTKGGDEQLIFIFNLNLYNEIICP